jgi:hypothetical protein
MWTGRRFRLKQNTLGVLGGKTACYIPAEALLDVAHGPGPNEKMVHVRWNNQEYEIFVRDLEERAEILRTKSQS